MLRRSVKWERKQQRERDGREGAREGEGQREDEGVG